MPMLKLPWRLARSLDQLVDEVKAKYPGTTIWTVGDEAHQRRNSDHNSNGQGVVCAIDVVGVTQARDLWDFLAHARDPRMKYDIFNSQKMSSTISPWTPRPYTGSNPHSNHIHVSVGRGPDNYSTRADLYDDPSPWGFHGATSETGEQMLKQGDKGNGVKKIQRALFNWFRPKAKGYKPNENGSTWERALFWGIDGDFGTTTEEMVKDYQKAAQIKVTGQVDGLTSSFLMEYVPDRVDRGLTKAQADKLYASAVHKHTENTELPQSVRDAFNEHRHPNNSTGKPTQRI